MNRKEENGFVSFRHTTEDDNSERVIVVQTDGDGMVVLTIFSLEEWQMIVDVAELTGQDLEQIITDVAFDSNIATIVLDPKDFF